MSVPENIKSKCDELNVQVNFVKTLAGKAEDPKWEEVDPNYTRLREMAALASDKVVTLANELRALIP